jgi:hypothetical protein
MQVVATAIDAGAGAGVLQIGTAAMAVVLASVPLDDPAASVGGAGVLTIIGLPNSVVAVGAGNAAAARIRDSNGVDVVTGLTVGTSGTDIIIDAVAVAVGQTIQLNSGTLTHAV